MSLYFNNFEGFSIKTELLPHSITGGLNFHCTINVRIEHSKRRFMFLYEIPDRFTDDIISCLPDNYDGTQSIKEIVDFLYFDTPFQRLIWEKVEEKLYLEGDYDSAKKMAKLEFRTGYEIKRSIDRSLRELRGLLYN